MTEGCSRDGNDSSERGEQQPKEKVDLGSEKQQLENRKASVFVACMYV